MITKYHYHFLLPLSPWPLISMLCCFNLMFSGLIFLKYMYFVNFIFSLIVLTISCFMWWISYSEEMNFIGNSSFTMEDGIKLAMILFISSEVFFFFSFFWSYFHFYLSPMMEISLVWPPVQVEAFDFSNVPMINTLVLLGSGMFMTAAHHYLLEAKMKNCAFNMLVTVILGGLFTVLQGMEYVSAFFGISDSSYGTSFFMLTGFHGIHVLIGTLFILTSFLRLLSSTCGKSYCVSLELAAWYWHFVDVVWIFLFFLIYYLNF